MINGYRIHYRPFVMNGPGERWSEGPEEVSDRVWLTKWGVRRAVAKIYEMTGIHAYACDSAGRRI